MIAVSTGRGIRETLRHLKGRSPVHLTRGKRVAKVWAVGQDTANGRGMWAFSLSVDGDQITDHVYDTAFSFYGGLEVALLGFEVETGEAFDRKRTRFRIEYEMPNAGMVQAWRHPGLIRGDVWYYAPVRQGAWHG